MVPAIGIKSSGTFSALRVIWSFSPVDAPARIAELERQLHWAELRIQVLEQQLRLRRIQLLGPHSETLSDLQLELLAEEEPGVTRAEVAAEVQRQPLPSRPALERKPHPG